MQEHSRRSLCNVQERDGAQGRAHIPFRNSMLTTALRDSLGGNCRTVMVANVAATSDQAEETISTCRFAQRVAMISNTVGIPHQMLRHGALCDACEQVERLRTADAASDCQLSNTFAACHRHKEQSS